MSLSSSTHRRLFFILFPVISFSIITTSYLTSIITRPHPHHFPATFLPRAPLPVDDPIDSFWIRHAGDVPTGQQPTQDEDVDIAVIGSGISGLSFVLGLVHEASQELQNSTTRINRIAVVEARTFCSGATGRNGGHMHAVNVLDFHHLSSPPATVRSAMAAVELERRSVHSTVAMIDGRGWKPDVDLVKGGKVALYWEGEEELVEKIKQGIEEAKSYGVNVEEMEWLDGEQTRKRYDTPAKVIASVKIPGNNVFPLRLVAHVYELAVQVAREKGIEVVLYTKTPVDSIHPASNRTGTDFGERWTLHSKKTRIHTPIVVHATNAYASHLLPSLQGLVLPTRGQAAALRTRKDDFNAAGPSWPSPPPGFGSNAGFEYFFQRPVIKGGQYIIGGGREVTSPPFEIGVADDGALNDKVSKFLRGYFGNWGGGKDLEVEMEWTGIMGFTANHDPWVGRVYENRQVVPGQYMSVGFSGHGMSRAPICAEALASLVLSDMGGSRWEPPYWLPNQYLTHARMEDGDGGKRVYT